MRKNLNKAAAPAAVTAAVERLGNHIAIARKRRSWPQEELAAKAGVHRLTLAKIEEGALGTGIGAYAAVLWAMGLDADLGLLAHPDRDEEGKTLEAARRPERVRPDRKLSSEF